MDVRPIVGHGDDGPAAVDIVCLDAVGVAPGILDAVAEQPGMGGAGFAGASPEAVGRRHEKVASDQKSRTPSERPPLAVPIFREAAIGRRFGEGGGGFDVFILPLAEFVLGS